jgi:hypothetical protein
MKFRLVLCFCIFIGLVQGAFAEDHDELRDLVIKLAWNNLEVLDEMENECINFEELSILCKKNSSEDLSGFFAYGDICEEIKKERRLNKWIILFAEKGLAEKKYLSWVDEIISDHNDYENDLRKISDVSNFLKNHLLLSLKK